MGSVGQGRGREEEDEQSVGHRRGTIVRAVPRPNLVLTLKNY